MIAVIYWSGTGNTEKMAELVCEGAEQKGAEVQLIEVEDFDQNDLDSYEGIAFGCPAMGTEVLEEYDFQPMWDEVKNKLANKKIVLFGSYDWGVGEWMDNWEEEAEDLGLNLVADGLSVNNYPEGEDEEKCRALGAALV